VTINDVTSFLCLPCFSLFVQILILLVSGMLSV
jgi:hypothetical protein